MFVAQIENQAAPPPSSSSLDSASLLSLPENFYNEAR
jgi:hypothetical protein